MKFLLHKDKEKNGKMPTHKTAHLQTAPADTQPKPPKELAYPNARTEKYAAKMKDKLSNDKNGQLVTKAKIKRAESVNLKGSTINKLHRNLTVKCSEMPASFSLSRQTV